MKKINKYFVLPPYFVYINLVVVVVAVVHNPRGIALHKPRSSVVHKLRGFAIQSFTVLLHKPCVVVTQSSCCCYTSLVLLLLLLKSHHVVATQAAYFCYINLLFLLHKPRDFPLCSKTIWFLNTEIILLLLLLHTSIYNLNE